LQVVYHAGCFYRLELFDTDLRLYTVEELTDAFIELICNRQAVTDTDAGHVAALAHDRRDQWARNREQFFLSSYSEANKQFLSTIESAMVFLTLDSTDYGSTDGGDWEQAVLDEYSSAMLTGDGANRWPDMALNFVVTANGAVGGNCEHACGDGAEFDHILENFLYVGNPECDV